MERRLRMAKRWSIRIHPAQGLMEFKFHGFWTEAEAQEWRKDYRAHVDRIAFETEGKFSFLVDLTDYPAQRKEVADINAECMGYGVSKGLKKAAHILTDVIAKMQMDKLNKQVDDTRFGNFLTRQEAEIWLKK
jgi:hypothetical protein